MDISYVVVIKYHLLGSSRLFSRDRRSAPAALEFDLRLQAFEDGLGLVWRGVAVDGDGDAFGAEVEQRAVVAPAALALFALGTHICQRSREPNLQVYLADTSAKRFRCW
jgi:hypothetical protein